MNLKFLFFSIFLLFPLSLLAQVTLNYQGEYKLLSTELLLGVPIAIESSEKHEKILWGEKSRFYFFDYYGNHIALKEASGRGPGEFVRADAYASNDEYVVIFDGSQSRVIYLDWDGNLISEFLIDEALVRNITLDDESNLITMNELIDTEIESALSMYNLNGTKLKSLGEVSIMALTQRSRNGGGLVTDDKNNLYYSYLSDGNLFKISLNNNQSKSLINKPKYFSSPDIDLVKKIGLDHMKMIPLTFAHSRVSGLFFLKPNFLFQQIEVGNPWQDEEVEIYLEITNTKTNKRINTVKIENRIATFWKEDELLIFDLNASKLSEKNLEIDNVLFKIYKVSNL